MGCCNVEHIVMNGVRVSETDLEINRSKQIIGINHESQDFFTCLLSTFILALCIVSGPCTIQPLSKMCDKGVSSFSSRSFCQAIDGSASTISVEKKYHEK